MLLRLFCIICVLAAASLGVLSQEVPKAEVFGGYSWTGPSLQGVDASITGNVNHWFGVTADYSGHFGSEQVSGIRLHKTAHTVQFGPRFSKRGKRLTPFAHALFGATRFKQFATIDDTYIYETATGFTSTVGGGLDVRVTKRVAIRAFQIDYFRPNFFGISDNRLRASFGVVFRIGKR